MNENLTILNELLTEKEHGYIKEFMKINGDTGNHLEYYENMAYNIWEQDGHNEEYPEFKAYLQELFEMEHVELSLVME